MNEICAGIKTHTQIIYKCNSRDCCSQYNGRQFLQRALTNADLMTDRTVFTSAFMA
ncbi:MAG: hypothetical protein ACOX4R_08580 [Lentihominibacter sp.]